MRTRHDKLTLSLALLGIAALTVLAYYPGMSAGFYFDDEQNLLEAGALHWEEISASNLSAALRDAHLNSRPVANLSLAANHLASGLDPAPYHWTNLAIHLATGLALYWVIRIFQRYHGGGSCDRNIALLAVLLFLVHPLNIQATTYVVQRMTSLSTLFVLLSLGSYVSGRCGSGSASRRGWYLLAATGFLLAVGSKELGFLLLPLLLLYEACFHGTAWRDGYRRAGQQAGHPLTVVAVSAIALLAVWLGCHALRRGYRVVVYTFNLRVFDPTWFQGMPSSESADGRSSPANPSTSHPSRLRGDVPAAQLIERLTAQMAAKSSEKLHAASRAYIEFLQLGGTLRMQDLNANLIRRYLKRSIPVLTGLSATYLYDCPREFGVDCVPDDIRGLATGHFVVLCGYDKRRQTTRVADPYRSNPLAQDHFYEVGLDRLVCSILLGVLTYDANLVVIQPQGMGVSSCPP